MTYLIIFCVYLLIITVSSLRSPSALLTALFSIFAIKGWLISSSPIFFSKPTIVNFAYAGTIALIAIIHFRHVSKSLIQRPVGWLFIIALYFYACISQLWAPESAHAGDIWKTAYPYVFINILILPLLLRDCNWSKFANLQIYIGSFFIALMLFTGDWGTRGLVVEDTQTNPLEIAQLGAVTAICALFSFQRGSVIQLIVRLASLGLAVAIILKSGSRGQLISMAISSLFIWLAVNGIFNLQKTVVLIMGAAVLIFSISWGINEFWSQTNPDRYSTETMAQDVQGRLDMAVKLVSAWIQSPVNILIGLGNSASFDPDIIGIYPHFIPLEILGEEGIIGFSLYLAIVLLTSQKIISAVKKIRRNIYLPAEVSQFSIGSSIWIYSFLLTLKQGNLIGNTIFFSLSVIVATSIRRFDLSARSRLINRSFEGGEEDLHSRTLSTMQPIHTGRTHRSLR